MKLRLIGLLSILSLSMVILWRGSPVEAQPSTGRTVFLILMENHDWANIAGNPSAPYINKTLLRIGAHAENYRNPPHVHPSEPNYLWLEAGTDFGIRNDSEPSRNHQASAAHLSTLLDAAGISWRAYQEGIDGTTCPLVSTVTYAAKHNPFVFFDDVTDGNDPHSAKCIAHNRPYSELAADLTGDRVARYNFITPDICHDMHDSGGCATPDSVRNGDVWLSQEVPKILASAAYQAGAVVLITWDEGEGNDGPIGMIALAADAKVGYANTVAYTHSSTLRMLETWFGVAPLLGDAANATDLSDLFNPDTTLGSTPAATQSATETTAAATP